MNISVQNDLLVKRGQDDWYGGRYNIGAGAIDSPMGTLVYDAYNGTASIQKISRYDGPNGVAVEKRYAYWAQGGISMSLKDDQNWSSVATSENLVSINDTVYRTALGYTNGSTDNIFGIVTQTACTAAQFRSAIKSTLLLDGAIFLDSGPSSQMRAVDNSGNVIKLTGGNTPQEINVAL